MNSRCCQTQQPHGVEKSNKVNYTNRNSTGSTNSSQTSSGFESSKSASSHQLAQPGHSTPAHHQLQQQNESPQAFQISPNEDNSISSPSSRLSSTGSSTATTQGGRSSAYFSLSDGLDLSSTGIGEVESGTLTTILKKGERSSKTERARRGNCSRVNIGEMLAKGIPEQEIFAEWLQRLCLSEYLALFLSQGYDLPTLARATPEDLTTLGITKPDDRKCLVQDIQCWQKVADTWPTDITKEAPTRDWLTAIGLKQYIQQFERQGCLTVGELEQLEAEDLEDMGVQKLGHAKRIWLALRKLRESRSFKPKPIQKVSSVQPLPSHNILPNTTLWPCSSNAAAITSSATLRRPQRNPSMTCNPTSGTELPKLREIVIFGTSQIIAQLPREPPELIEKEEDVEELNYLMGHIPPPPAPMPLLAFPTTSSTNSTRQVTFGCSLSQPTTPRNVQRMFGPFDDIQQQQQPPLQNL
uniref:SAM domain-containing protein n=1 Tax=Meloidogyne floridensis TaxID=298350 RepID=A0A915P197_9BILA